MSHQTGIKCNSELREFIANVKEDDNHPMFSVQIENEQLTLAWNASGTGDLKKDLEDHLASAYIPAEPRYIFVQISAKPSNWLLIFYSPDNANTRKKMLYASTKTTLKNEFGSGNISMEYFATTLDEMTSKSVVEWYNQEGEDDESRDSNNPWSTDSSTFDTERGCMRPRNQNTGDLNKKNVEFLTANEIEKLSIKAQEFQESLSKNEKSSGMLGVPLSDEAKGALKKFFSGSLSYINFIFVIEKEQIDLAISNNDQVMFDVQGEEAASTKLLNGLPDKGFSGFHLLRFPHTDPNGDRLVKTLLILLVDPNFTKPRERMMYASFCASLTNELDKCYSIQIDKRLEADDANDVTVTFVAEKLYPQLAAQVDTVRAVEETVKFTKPRGPPGRGPRRIIK